MNSIQSTLILELKKLTYVSYHTTSCIYYCNKKIYFECRGENYKIKTKPLFFISILSYYLTPDPTFTSFSWRNNLLAQLLV